MTAYTPPTFVWHTFDDELVALENTLLFVQAMYRQNVPVEYHVFHTGRHGMSMCTSEVGEPGAEHCAHWFKPVSYTHLGRNKADLCTDTAEVFDSGSRRIPSSESPCRPCRDDGG